jgi:hypothetical protein
VVKELTRQFRSVEVFNLHVKDLHTYAVSGTGVLVHNKPLARGTLEEASDGVVDATRKGGGLPPMKGRKPDPVKWVEGGGSVQVHPNGDFTFVDVDGTAVRYRMQPDGHYYPDFQEAGLVIDEVHFDVQGNRTTDFTTSNRLRSKPQPASTTWHHHEDLQRTQLMDFGKHARFQHRGAVSIKKGGN